MKLAKNPVRMARRLGFHVLRSNELSRRLAERRLAEDRARMHPPLSKKVFGAIRGGYEDLRETQERALPYEKKALGFAKKGFITGAKGVKKLMEMGGATRMFDDVVGGERGYEPRPRRTGKSRRKGRSREGPRDYVSEYEDRMDREMGRRFG